MTLSKKNTHTRPPTHPPAHTPPTHHHQESHIGCRSLQGLNFFSFFSVNVFYKWRNDKNKMCGIYLHWSEKRREDEKRCHGWVNWKKAHLITKKQWPLQIHKFAGKQLEFFEPFYCFGRTTTGNGTACMKRLRSAGICQEVTTTDLTYEM